MAKKQRKQTLKKEVDEIKKTEEEILRRLAKEEKKEDEIEDIEKKVLSKVERIGQPIPNKVKNFTFSDFGQAVVGALVFGIPAMWTPDFWNFINGSEAIPPIPIPTYKLITFHLFTLFCIITVLNFTFRKSFSLDLHFLKHLVRRIFYIYITVVFVEIVIMWMFNKVTASITTITLIRYILATTSIGMVGAVTFDFIMD